MKTRIILITAFLFPFFIISCDKDGDTTPPNINLISPAEGEFLEIGNEDGIHFEAEFSDDEMLASYKIEIHNNFNDHGHEHSKAEESTTPFFYQNSWDISGSRNTTIHHREIIIPENATPGNYHLLLYCTDAAGNESYVARNIILSQNEDEEHIH
ncbi:MAG: DUF4625 domain-containing protein [Rikenellaceae bacterium]|nr:DUF4625 domain-containing protein [Rikenellaceae bacterium]